MRAINVSMAVNTESLENFQKLQGDAVKSFGWVNFKRNRFPIYEKCCKTNRLASVGILGKEREPEVGSLGWQENFDTGFESYFVQNPVCRFFKVS